MWLARTQLGTILDVYLQTLNASGVGTMPDEVPLMKVWLGATLKLSAEMPVFDKTVTIGLFRYQLFLGTGYSVGQYTIGLHYSIAGSSFNESRTFDVIAGGDQHGQVLSMAWLHKPQVDFAVYQTESGEVLAGKNPRLR